MQKTEYEQNKETGNVREDRSGWIKNKYVIIVISMILSGINIYLAATLEPWTQPADRLRIMLFCVLGTAAGYVLVRGFFRQHGERLRVHSLVWGVLMSAAYVLGGRLGRDGTVLSGLRHLPGLLVQIAFLAVPIASGVAYVLRGRSVPHQDGFGQRAQRLYERCVKRSGARERAGKQYRPAQIWILYAAVIFLCWLPVFLAYYPSVFAYDAEGQLYQVIAHDYSTHHPLLHTLFLGAFFRMGAAWFHSVSIGMAVHSVVQMALMAAAFGYTLSYLYRRGVPVYLRVLLALFYALFPANSILALSTTKDVLFAALVLLYTLTLHRFITKQRCDKTEEQPKTEALRDRGLLLGYVVWAVLMLLFRNNAVYAIILSIPVVCLLLRGEKGMRAGTWKRYLFGTGIALLMFAVCAAALKSVTGAQNGSPREMLSVPLQQMARTRVVAEDTLSEEMRQELDRYLPSEWVMAAYNSHLADPVKNRAVIHDDPAGLIKTWIKLGMQHPQIYIDAFLDNSIGYWYVQDRSHAQIYGIGTESGFGYLSTDNRTMPAGCEIVEHSYLPALRAGMERIVSDNVYQKLPVIRLIFAPALYWWLLCMYTAKVIYRKRYELLIPAVFLMCYYMTLLLSPTVLIRYMYPFVVAVPAICCCLTVDLMDIKGKNIQ